MQLFTQLNKYSDQIFKILLLGDAGVGKSSIILRYTKNEYNAKMVSSIGVDFKAKDIIVNDKKVKLQLWDTAGHERFRTITTSYYRGAHGIATVFDLSDRESFEHIDVDEILIDGTDSGDIGNLVLKDREMLGSSGIVIISCTLDKSTKKVLNLQGFKFF